MTEICNLLEKITDPMVIITDLLLVKRLKFVYPSIDFVAHWIDDQRTRAPHVLVDQPGSTQQTFCPPVNCSRDRERRGEIDLSMFPWRASGRRTRGFLLGAMPARGASLPRPARRPPGARPPAPRDAGVWAPRPAHGSHAILLRPPRSADSSAQTDPPRSHPTFR